MEETHEELASRALNSRRALSEDAPLRRTRTLDQSYENEDMDEETAKRRRVDPLLSRAVSEILPEVSHSLIGSVTEVDPDGTLVVREEEDETMTQPQEDDIADQCQQRCVYIDRISPDVSDKKIKKALDDGLPPCGVAKVESLEVIRTQKSRHVHAFAILTQRLEEPGPLEVPVDGGEYIKVQHASKQLRIPEPTKPCRTLHIRVYARRSGWGHAVTRMTWAGLLAILEMSSPGISSSILMVADDRSARSNTSHQSVLLSVFFAECATVEDAIRVHDAVHDSSTRGLDDILFLIRADFARGDKSLHDTSENLDPLREKFAAAQNFARSVAEGKDDSWAVCENEDCPVPEAVRRPHKVGLCHSFEFGNKRLSPEKRRRGKRAQQEGGGDQQSPPKEPKDPDASPKKRPKKGKASTEQPKKVMMSRGVSQVELSDRPKATNDDPWSHGRT